MNSLPFRRRRCGKDFGFTLEPREALPICGNGVRQHLDGDGPPSEAISASDKGTGAG